MEQKFGVIIIEQPSKIVPSYMLKTMLLPFGTCSLLLNTNAKVFRIFSQIYIRLISYLNHSEARAVVDCSRNHVDRPIPAAARPASVKSKCVLAS